MIKLGKKKNQVIIQQLLGNGATIVNFFPSKLLATKGQRNNSNQGQGIIEIVFNRTDGN